MSAEAAALVRSFRVGRRTVTMTFPTPERGGVCALVIEWSPHPPTRLSRREWEQYRAGRGAAVADLSELTGLKPTVLEI